MININTDNEMYGYTLTYKDIHYLYHRTSNILDERIANTLSPINQVRLNTISVEIL